MLVLQSIWKKDKEKARIRERKGKENKEEKAEEKREGKKTGEGIEKVKGSKNVWEAEKR